MNASLLSGCGLYGPHKWCQEVEAAEGRRAQTPAPGLMGERGVQEAKEVKASGTCRL